MLALILVQDYDCFFVAEYDSYNYKMKTSEVYYFKLIVLRSSCLLIVVYI